MASLRRTTVALALAALAAVARAQEAAPQLQQDPRAARFHEVERGFFVGFEAGALGFLKTPTQDAAKYPYAGSGGGASGGFLYGVDVGTDLGDRTAIALVLLGANETASVNYGAFSVYALGGDVRFAPFAFRDANGTERAYLYVHGRAAFARSYPSGLFGSDETYLAAGPGVEYFTQLRHFSVGLAVDAAYAVKAKAAGYSPYLTVRYTF